MGSEMCIRDRRRTPRERSAPISVGRVKFCNVSSRRGNTTTLNPLGAHWVKLTRGLRKKGRGPQEPAEHRAVERWTWSTRSEHLEAPSRLGQARKASQHQLVARQPPA